MPDINLISPQQNPADPLQDVPFQDPQKQVQGGAAVPQEPQPTLDPELVKQARERFRAIDSGQNALEAQAFIRATRANPELAGEAQRLGVELSLEPDVVERNIEKMRALRREQLIKNLQATQDHPVLQQMMLQPDFAGVSGDKIAELSVLEKTYQFFNQGWLRGREGVLWDKIRQGVATPEEMAQALDVGKQLESLPQDSSGQGLLGSLWYGTWSTLGQMGESMPEALAYGGALGGTALVLGNTGPQAFLPEELVTVPTMFGAGFRAGLFGHTAAIEAGQSYKTMREMGINHETASNASWFVGLVNGIAEVGGFEALTHIARKEIKTMITKEAAKDLLVNPTYGAAAKRFVTGALKGTAGEVLQEVAQEVSSIIGEQVALAKQKDIDPSTIDWQKVEENSHFAERIGGIIAETFRGTLLISGFGPLLRLRRDMNQIKNADKTGAFLDQLRAGVDASKLDKRAPSMLARFLRTLSEGSPVESVFFKQEEFAAGMDRAKMTEEQLQQLSPEVAKAYAESRQTGVVEIPMHTWGSQFLTSKLGESLAQDARVDADGVSIAEIRKTGAEEEKKIVAEAEKVLTEKEKTDKQFREQVAQVRKAMSEQLQQAGQTKEHADAEAQLYAHFVTIFSNHEKMSPTDWHAMHGVKFMEASRAPAIGDALSQDFVATEGPANEQAMQQQLLPAGQVPQIGAETGTIASEGVSRLDSPHGSTRFVYSEGGRPVSVVQVVSAPGKPATIATAYTAPEARRRGIAAKLVKAAREAFPDVQPGGMTEAGAGLMNAVWRSPSTTTEQANAQAAEQAAKPPVAETTVTSANELGSTKKWGKVRDLKVALQDRIRAALKNAGLQLTEQRASRKGVAPTTQVVESKENEDYLVQTGLYDALFALRQNPNAVGWYDLKTRQAIAVVATVHPEILTDEDARFAFVYALAVTSNGLKVDKNFQLAEAAYVEYKKTGVMPSNVGIGNAAKAINEKLAAFNDLKKTFGLERMRQLLLSRGRAGMFEQATGLEVTGEWADTEVLGAAVLGPKIGNGFFANLYGMFGQLTMDRWLIRTWGRWTGTLLVDRPDMIASSGEELHSIVSGLSEKDRAAIDKLLGLDTMAATPEELAKAIKKFSEDPEQRQQLNDLPGGDELRRTGNTLWKWIDGQKEAPANPGERVFIRKVFQRILDELKKRPGLADLTMADLQAVLWYAERRIYESAKEDQSATSDVEGYTDDEAPDYAVAASKLAAEKGVSQRKINNALTREEQSDGRAGDARQQPDGSGAQAAGPVGRSQGLEARTLRQVVGHQAVVEARAARRDAAGASWRVGRKALEGSGGRGVLNKKLGTTVIAQITLGRLFANRLKGAGVNVQTPIFELNPADERSAPAFLKAILEFKKRKPEHAASVHAYDDYTGMRLFLSKDGQSGVAVKPDGDIVSVFSGGGQARVLVETAIEVGGGVKADAFDIGLADLYAGHGLRVVSRVSWDDSQAPAGWSKKHFAQFNGGEPDVVFMVHDANYTAFYERGDGGKPVAYSTAVRRQNAALQQRASSLSAATGRGRIYPALRLAVLEKNADPTTVIHELSHFFFTTLVRVASQDGAPLQVREDMETLLRWFADKGGLDIDAGSFDAIAQWNALSLKQQEKFHEMLAYNFELYAFEGKAPTPKLEGLFARMRTWMIETYRNIRDQLNRIYKSKFGVDLPVLTPEVRMVFDRMVASEDTIQQAEAVRHMLPLYQTKDEFVAAGFTEEQWTDYQRALQEAHAAAVTDLTRASMSQLRWLKNARSRALRELQKQGKKVRESVEVAVRKEVEQEQVYMALELLRGAKGESKLSLDGVRALLAGLDEKARDAAEKKLGTGKNGVLAKAGADVETTAMFLGYESGDQMVRALLAARPIQDVVDERTDQEMAKQHGELTDPKKMEAAIEKALHSEARARFIAVEQSFLTGSGKPARVMLMAARFAAQRVLEGRTVKSLRPDRYAQAEARAAQDAARASRPSKETKKGDPAAAVEAKRRQLLNNQLAAEAIAAREEIAKFIKWAKRFERSNERIAKAGVDVNIVNVGRWLLGRVGLLSNSMSDRTVDYLQMLQRYNPDLFEEHQSMLARFAKGPFDYRDFTLGEFRALMDAVRTLWAKAEREKQVEIAGDKQQVSDVVRQLLQQISGDLPATVPGEVRGVTKGERVGRLLLGTKGNLTRVEHLFRYLDGGEHGAFSTMLFDDLRLALDKYRVRAQTFTARLVAMVRALPLNLSPIDATQEFGYTFTGGDADLVGLLLHMGNVSNMEKALVAGRGDGRSWASFTPEGEVDTSQWVALRDRLVKEGRLKKEHFAFAQAVWDMMEEIKPLLQDAHQYLEGYLFKEVKARPFTIEFPDGSSVSYAGGYVPAAADTELMGTSGDPVTPDSLQDDFRREIPKVNFGSVKERIDTYRRRPLTLDVRKIAQHIDKAMRFAYVQPRIRDVVKILGGYYEDQDGKRFSLGDALNRLHPNLVKDVLMPWLDRAATQTLYRPGGDPLWNAIGKFLRRNTGIAVMMANPVNALQQVTGISNSFAYVGRGFLVNGLKRYMSQRGELVDWIVERSDFMRDRLDNQMHQLRTELDEMLLDPSSWSKVQQWTIKKAYALQSMVQNQVDIVTWVGAFDQEMASARRPGETAEMHEHRAIVAANSTVRLAQGSMNPEDVAAYEVGSPWQRTWTQFTGFLNNTLNAIGYSDNKVRAAILSFTIPMIISEAIAKALWGQWRSDDPEREKWMLDGWVWDGIDVFALSQIRGAFGFLPAVGPAAYSIVDQALGGDRIGDKVAASPAIVQLYRSVAGIVDAIRAAASEQRTARGSTWRDVMSALTQLTGLPLAPLGRPLGYAVDVGSGKVHPTNPIDFVRGLLTGRASTGSKR